MQGISLALWIPTPVSIFSAHALYYGSRLLDPKSLSYVIQISPTPQVQNEDLPTALKAFGVHGYVSYIFLQFQCMQAFSKYCQMTTWLDIFSKHI